MQQPAHYPSKLQTANYTPVQLNVNSIAAIDSTYSLSLSLSPSLYGRLFSVTNADIIKQRVSNL